MTALELTIRDVEGWPMAFEVGSEEPRLRDLDLGERLKYGRPRDVRKLVERHVENLEKLNDLHRCATVARGAVPEIVTEYYLTEAQALWIAAKSETEPAIELLGEMIRAYMLARRGALPPLPGVAPGPRLGIAAPFAEALRLAMANGDEGAAHIAAGAIARLLGSSSRAPRAPTPPPDPEQSRRKRIDAAKPKILTWIRDENTAGRGPMAMDVVSALRTRKVETYGAIHDLVREGRLENRGNAGRPAYWATARPPGDEERQAWGETIERWLAARSEAVTFTTLDDVLEQALELPPARWPAAYAPVSAILGRLGWTKGDRREKKGGVKITPFYRPAATP